MHHNRRRDSGQVTAEYAVGTVGAATLCACVLIGPGRRAYSWLRDWSFDLIEASFTQTWPDLVRWPW